MVRRRATLRLLLDCDNACIFCGQAGLSHSIEPRNEEGRARALDEARTVGDEITFVGGEPTLDPTLSERIASARARGFRRVGIQTNGRKLAGGEFVASLVAAGLTDAHFSIHGADPAVHDYHTGVEGSLVESLAGMSAARAHGLIVAVTTVLTRSNFRNLVPIARLLGARGASAWLLAVPNVAGRAALAFDRVVPRLGLAVPFALHALETASALGLPAFIHGAPLCVLGPFAARALADPEVSAHAFAAPCDSCAARPTCGGVEAEYLARFGDGELSPRESVVAAEDDADLRALFVGVGELAREVEGKRPVEPPPERARASLPILGKVRPARAEASPAVERKTGESLREIFPDLFEGRPKDS